VSAPFMTPGAGPVRTRVERRAAVIVLWLSQQPRFLPAAVVAVVFVLGLVLPGVAGAVLLLLCLALLAVLSYLAWPSTPASGRPVRLLVMVAIAIFIVSKLA
jgi:uncharacterized membrane protein